MSAIANRRDLMEAAQMLVKTNRPTQEHYKVLLHALAKVATDDTGTPLTCTLEPALAVPSQPAEPVAQAEQQPCRDDGRCQYAIDVGAEGLGRCPQGKCVMPSHPAAEQESERERFEAWAKSVGYEDQMLADRRRDEYLEPYLQEYWECWQAARRPLRELSDDEVDAIWKEIEYAAQRSQQWPFASEKKKRRVFARALLARATGEEGK